MKGPKSFRISLWYFLQENAGSVLYIFSDTKMDAKLSSRENLYSNRK